MELSDRQTEIIDAARRAGRVSVDALAAEFDVSTQTIRRDLNELSGAGLLARVHGGAVLSRSIANVGYDQRRGVETDAKSAIGALAAALIPGNCSLIINIGTTTEQVARALYNHRDLVVITNNINVVNILSGSPSKELVLAGGTVRQTDGAIVGGAAVEFIGRFKADYAVIGASAIDFDGALLDYDAREVAVAKAIIANSRRRILVCDRHKFDRTAPVRICSLEDIDMFVSDRPPPAPFAAACAAHGVEVVTPASPPPEAGAEPEEAADDRD